MKRYKEIYKDIEEKIKNKKYTTGSLLPSESQLSQTYGASRDTIRKALSLLVNNGFIQKQQGKSSVVIRSNRLNFPVSGLTSYKELQEAYGFESQTKVLQLEKKLLSQKEAKRTGLPEGETVWHLLRLRFIEKKAVVLDEDVLLAKYIPKLTKKVAENSIYAYFEDQLDLNIAYADKEITIVAIDERDQKYLHLAPKDINIVSVKSHVFLSDATMFQYTESRHQVDRFRFIDFARRKKS